MNVRQRRWTRLSVIFTIRTEKKILFFRCKNLKERSIDMAIKIIIAVVVVAALTIWAYRIEN